MWDGNLDELAIFNHALSTSDIRALYELGSDDQSGDLAKLDVVDLRLPRVH
jgi:hypothetical protein